MLPDHASAPQPARNQPRRIGVGIDTPRYGHYAAFLRDDLQLAVDQLGLASRLRGSGPQRRAACPIHRGDARGRTFSVHLGDSVFQCFDASCAKKGDVIDLSACEFKV